MEDDRAIRDVLARVGYTADDCEDDAFVALFTDDGGIRLSNPKAKEAFGGDGFAEWQGRDGVHEFITHPKGHHRPELYGKSMHLHGNNLVTRIDGDEATAGSYGAALVAGDDGVSVLSAGNNHWRLRRVDGRWLLVERRGTSLGDEYFASNLDETKRQEVES